MIKLCKYCNKNFELIPDNWPCKNGIPTGGRCLACHRAESAMRRLNPVEKARQREHSKVTKRTKYALDIYYREAEKQKARLFARNNKGYINARNMLRRQLLKYRTPVWLTKQDKHKIVQVYKEAANLTTNTGIAHHVDHIVPLQGKNVSGLHVPWNLQVITAKQNLTKHNSFKG